MEEAFAYAPLLERARKVPDPSLQRLAVASLFQKLRSAPEVLASAAGRKAISGCLHSSAAAADQAAREICSLVVDGCLPPDEALLELQASIEDCEPRFLPLLVKAIGFICRLAFRSEPSWGRRAFHDRAELHPFSKVLSSSRVEAQDELVRQVLLFIVRGMAVGVDDELLAFLKPFFLFSIVRIPFAGSSSSAFARDMISSLTSLCCSLPPSSGISIIRLVTACLKYFPSGDDNEWDLFSSSSICLVEAFIVVLKQIVVIDMLHDGAQACCLELLESLLSVCTGFKRPHHRIEILTELCKRLLASQKELGLKYLPEFSLVGFAMSNILPLVEFEHVYLSVLNLLIFLVEWKTESGYYKREVMHDLWEESLLIYPVISLLSVPSKSVKSAANYLLSALERLIPDFYVASEKLLPFISVDPSPSKPHSVHYRLLKHIWCQEQASFQNWFIPEFIHINELGNKESSYLSMCWTSEQRKCSLFPIDLMKTLQASKLQLYFPGMHAIVSSMAFVLVLHPTLGALAVNSLASLVAMDSSLCMPVLLSILFYRKVQQGCKIISAELLHNLLEIIPTLARHSAMVPFVIQTFLPMLHSDAKPILYAAALRFLCKTWMTTDRVFGNLQELLAPASFSAFISKRDICISIAASVRDVCRHNPDRGIDLILSVSSSIESQISSVRAIGFESLGHLCESDVVDFYTAWDVISIHTTGYLTDPIVAQGLCKLLRWGALDAEAYSESSHEVLHLLWDVGTFRRSSSEKLWVKAQVYAFKSLSSFQVAHIQRAIPDFKKSLMSSLLSEVNVELLDAIGETVVVVINFEHLTRRRVLKEKRTSVNKAEKMLDVFPQVIFPAGNEMVCSFDLPGAALLIYDFSPKALQEQLGFSQYLSKLHSAYVNALVEISESLNVSRNLILGLLALQSWMAFTERWVKMASNFSEEKASSHVSDKTFKAANDILKAMQNVSARSVPRVAVNVGLAIGALSSVLPPSAHTVTSAATQFLLKWLFQFEHEHLQWPAAISLGLISKRFHFGDNRQKFEVINGLLKVLSDSRSCLVKGACGVGLGFACQSLLGRVEADVDSNLKERPCVPTEATLLKYIIRSLSRAICQLCPAARGTLELLDEFFSPDGDICDDEASFLPGECSFVEDESWAAAGLVMGLGYAVVAIYRIGAYDAVLKIKGMLISWLSLFNIDSQVSILSSEMSQIPLFLGSCITLPAVVYFCQRVELSNDDIDGLFKHYSSLVSELVRMRKSCTIYHNVLMASCVGAGSFVSCVLNGGLHSLKLDEVKHLLELLRETYNGPYPSLIKLGGMLGVVNAFGARAGTLTDMHPRPASSLVSYDQQESSFIRSPIIRNASCEQLSTSIIQELFWLAKESKDQQIRSYAAWAVSFLRNHYWSNESEIYNGSRNSSLNSLSTSQGFSDDSLVLSLCLWLRDIKFDQAVDILHTSTISTVLKCLSKAPRLPSLDWGAIVRRCMMYEKQISSTYSRDQVPKSLREECLQFSIAHAKHVSSLLTFLDELIDLSRFRMLEPNLQSILLNHLNDLWSLFPDSRRDKLLRDLVNYFCLSNSSFLNGTDQKSSLRTVFWRALSKFIMEATSESLGTSNIKKYVEEMFSLLPLWNNEDSLEQRLLGGDEEWLEAIRCLANAGETWLLDMLQVGDTGTIYDGKYLAIRIVARCRLITAGCIPMSELGKLKAPILNRSSEGYWWNVLVEVASALGSAPDSIKRQWLLDAVQISCMSEFPTTGLRFVGILASSWCAYMPLLIFDPVTVMSDLPVTLPSLLADSKWTSMAEPITHNMWLLTEHICGWASWLAGKLCDPIPRPFSIDESEAPVSDFLARVLHASCVGLRQHLPFEKQLRLAMLEVP